MSEALKTIMILGAGNESCEVNWQVLNLIFKYIWYRAAGVAQSIRLRYVLG